MTNRESFITESLFLQIATLNDNFQNFQKQMKTLTSQSTLPQWVTLAKAVEYKGGGTIGTYRNQPYLQPCCGKNASWIGGIKVWSKEDVIAWSLITTKELPSYAASFNISLPVNFLKNKIA